ncbi:MAG: hypothetical protein ACFNJN_07430 [Capnocytophaga ochracea]
MNLRALLLIFLWGGCLSFFAQERDTTYIQPYPQEIWLRAYTAYQNAHTYARERGLFTQLPI